MRYTPIVDIIRRRDILQEFPERTETNLYFWLCHNHEELEAHYGDRVLMEKAADDLADRFDGTRLPARPAKQAARWMTGAALSRVTTWWRALRRAMKED